MAARAEYGPNRATGTLKLIALVFMCFDHFGKMIFPACIELRILGRIAFPVYAWCLAIGAEHTHSFPRYMGRMLLMGIISQPLYILALNHTWREPNIFFTLCLGLAALWGIRRNWFGSALWAPAAAMLLAYVGHFDYGWKGILFIVLLYMSRESRSGIAAMMIAYCMYWGTTSIALTSFFGIPLTALGQSVCGPLLTPWFRLQAWAILSLPLILIPMERNYRLNQVFSYAIYPGHLLVLLLTELALGLVNGTWATSWQQMLGRLFLLG